MKWDINSDHLKCLFYNHFLKHRLCLLFQNQMEHPVGCRYPTLGLIAMIVLWALEGRKLNSILHHDLDLQGFRKWLLPFASQPLFHQRIFLLACEDTGHEIWALLWPSILVFVASLALTYICRTIHSSLHSLSHCFLLPFTCTYTHAHAQRRKSICVRHSARERQRHWVNYPSFTAAEKSRWQQTICKWQGAVNYSIFLD